MVLFLVGRTLNAEGLNGDLAESELPEILSAVKSVNRKMCLLSGAVIIVTSSPRRRSSSSSAALRYGSGRYGSGRYAGMGVGGSVGACTLVFGVAMSAMFVEPYSYDHDTPSKLDSDPSTSSVESDSEQKKRP